MRFPKKLKTAGYITCVVIVIAGVLKTHSPLIGSNVGESRVTYVWDLCAGQNDLWVVYPTKMDRSEFSIYNYESGERSFDTHPRFVKPPLWNPVTERFYYLSDKRLTEYDPVTGDTNQYKLEQKYAAVNVAPWGNLLLILENGEKYLFDLPNEQTTKLDIKGSLVAHYDHYLLLKRYEPCCELFCYDYQAGQELWSVNVEVLSIEDVGRKIAVTQDRVWFWGSGSRTLLSIDILTGEYAYTKTQSLTYAIGTEHGLICVGKTANGFGFYILSPDGAQIHFGDIDSDKINNQFDPIRMTVFQGKLYYAFVEEKIARICSYNLPT